MTPLERAIEILGGVAELARAAGVAQSTISMAGARGSVSPALAARIEEATGGKVRKESLVWPAEPQSKAA